MPKTVLTYSSLTIASLVMVAGFITATSYAQLAAASLLYPLLVFVAYKVLPIRGRPYNHGQQAAASQAQIDLATVEEEKEKHVGISDIEKRAFLKLIGATGISFFLVSIFGRRIEALLFGGQSTGQPNIATASPTEGYKITEIDNGLVGYYGFVNKDGAWIIMKEDTDSGSFRYTKGTSNFPLYWKSRKELKYDYFYQIF